MIGVHQPRYLVDQDNARVLKHINRLFIRFPVVNDADFRLARMFQVESWPTAVILDTEGAIAGIYPGSGRRAEFESKIQSLLEDAAARDARNFEPMPQARKPEPNSTLSFPTGIALSDNAIYVADTGRNRVLELSPEGRLQRTFGSGNAGLFDGRLTEAGFNAPTGLALSRDQLFVADTGNHALRRIRLLSGEVDTLAGTGRLSTGLLDSGLARVTSLASPMGLAAHQERLYIGMAGLHQLWAYDFQTQSLSVVAGNGREELVDGFGEFASFSQPVCLSLGKDALYIADPGLNSIRSLRLVDGSITTPIEGTAFEEGDVDGVGAQARIAGARALAFDLARGVLWILDSVNGKLKVYAPAKAELKTLKLNYNLQEPAGIAVRGNELWILNTHAHELLKLDLKTGKLSRVNVT
jgi:sugar lactone lactonase YvrE